MQHLISIIVPIYNTEKHLEKCIESILQQTNGKYELILVNDGSTDNSERICHEFLKKDSRIKYFYKENTGVSDTRNYGIKKANGDYITFVDSDDYIDKDYINKAYELIEKKYDMVVFDHAIIDNRTEKYIEIGKESEDITYPKYVIKYFTSYAMSTACKMIYKKQMIVDNGIEFDKTLKYGEDMLFSFEAYINSKSTYYEKYCAYYYLMNIESASHDNTIEKRIKYCEDNIRLYEKIKDILKIEECDEIYRIYLDALLRNLLSGLDMLFLSKQDKGFVYTKQIVKKYKKYLENFIITKSSLSTKAKIKILLLKLKQYKLLECIVSVKNKNK